MQVFLILFPSAVFYFLAKTYGKKEGATYAKAVLRAVLWSVIFCWSSLQGGSLEMWGHSQVSVPLPYLASIYLSGVSTGEYGSAYYFMSPSLWVTPWLPIAFYLSIFHLYYTGNIQPILRIRASIKPLAIMISTYLVILALSFFVPVIIGSQYPLMSSVSIIVALLVANKYSPTNYGVALFAILLLTLALPYFFLFSGAPSTRQAIELFYDSMGAAKTILFVTPATIGLGAYFAINYITRNSRATPKSDAH
jgi:hypothetical protein